MKSGMHSTAFNMTKQNQNKAGNFKDGQWNVVHLKFLADFMRAAGLSTTRVADQMELSRQSVYYWFAKDDMKISQVYRLFEKFGYKIAFSYEKESAAIELPVVVKMTVKKQDEPKKLSFVSEALDIYAISREELASKLQVGKSTISHWLSCDDCFISYIYRIATAADLKLAITIQPIE